MLWYAPVADQPTIVDPPVLPRATGESDEQYAKRCAWATDPRNANSRHIARTRAREDVPDTPIPPMPDVASGIEARTAYAVAIAKLAWEQAHRGKVDPGLNQTLATAYRACGWVKVEASKDDDSSITFRGFKQPADPTPSKPTA